jgi:hypothetical protein
VNQKQQGWWLYMDSKNEVTAYRCPLETCEGKKRVDEVQCPEGFDPSPNNVLCSACDIGYTEWRYRNTTTTFE